MALRVENFRRFFTWRQGETDYLDINPYELYYYGEDDCEEYPEDCYYTVTATEITVVPP